MRRVNSTPLVDFDCEQRYQLPQQQLDSLRTEVESELNNALAECNKLRGSIRVASWPLWKIQAQMKGLSAYAQTHDSALTSRISGSIRGKYSDIARFFRSETREKYFKVQKSLCPDTVDASILSTVPQRASRPSVSEGIKWALHNPSWHRSPMDACVFESTGMGLGSDGRPYFCRVVIPTTFPRAPELATEKHSVRVLCRSVMISSPLAQDPSYSDVFMTMRTDFKTIRMPRGFYKRLLRGLCNVGVEASEKQNAAFVLDQVLRDLKKRCHVCSRDFSVLRTKHQCSLCGEAVCRKCLVTATSTQPRWWRSSTHSKVCKPCSKRRHVDEAHDTPLLEEGVFGCKPVSSHERNFECDGSEWPRKSSKPEWVTTPLSWQSSIEEDDLKQEDVIEARISALSSQSFYSISPSSTSLGDGTAPNDTIFEDAEWTLEKVEEDDERNDLLSRNESSTIFTIDTSEMTPVSSLGDSVDFEVVSPSMSPSLLHSIGSSIREQLALLADA